MKIFIILAAFVVVIHATISDQEQWVTFKSKYSKDYEPVEDKVRFEIFQKNLRLIEKHNAEYEKGEVSYFLKVTKFTDWTKEEFRSILKYQAVDEETRAAKKIVPSPDFVRPESVDWREKGAVLMVKDQGMCGACWAFSATGALEAQIIIQSYESAYTLSEQELVDCDDKCTACQGGNMRKAFDYVKENGISSEFQYPYKGFNYTCLNTNSWKKPLKTISGYVVVERSEDAIADALAAAGPISVGVEANDNWQNYAGGVFDDPTCQTNLSHAVLVVGYSDDYWIIKNSWGDYWGEDGFIRLKRGVNRCGINSDPSYPQLQL